MQRPLVLVLNLHDIMAGRISVFKFLFRDSSGDARTSYFKYKTKKVDKETAKEICIRRIEGFDEGRMLFSFEDKTIKVNMGDTQYVCANAGVPMVLLLHKNVKHMSHREFGEHTRKFLEEKDLLSSKMTDQHVLMCDCTHGDICFRNRGMVLTDHYLELQIIPRMVSAQVFHDGDYQDEKQFRNPIFQKELLEIMRRDNSSISSATLMSGGEEIPYSLGKDDIKVRVTLGSSSHEEGHSVGSKPSMHDSDTLAALELARKRYNVGEAGGGGGGGGGGGAGGGKKGGKKGGEKERVWRSGDSDGDSDEEGDQESVTSDDGDSPVGRGILVASGERHGEAPLAFRKGSSSSSSTPSLECDQTIRQLKEEVTSLKTQLEAARALVIQHEETITSLQTQLTRR